MPTWQSVLLLALTRIIKTAIGSGLPRQGYALPRNDSYKFFCSNRLQIFPLS